MPLVRGACLCLFLPVKKESEKEQEEEGRKDRNRATHTHTFRDGALFPLTNGFQGLWRGLTSRGKGLF